MAKNPYIILGVSLSASDGEIRTAFRNLAKQYHPDRNPDNPAAEEKFKEVSRAFDILGDSDRRRKYDRGEIDAEGKPADPFARQYGGREGAAERARQQRTPFGQNRSKGAARPGGPSAGASFDDLSDIFSDLFGNPKPRAQTRGRDVRYRMDVDFLDAVHGATKRVTMPDGRVLDLTIPPGLEDEQTLRLRGQGEPGEAGGEDGDVYVETRIKSHSVFTRDGHDIHAEVSISLREAVMGGKITVPTIGGDVSVNVPKGANSGTTLRLRGRGAPAGDAQDAGDQYVKLRIVLPEKLDPALQDFVANWDAGKEHNPRRTPQNADVSS
ncbi:MAG: DnaJ C-terminal domain-containing protein [Pseudomonadota bacterium]